MIQLVFPNIFMIMTTPTITVNRDAMNAVRNIDVSEEGESIGE
jgi:hypothetical protein